MDDIFPFSYCDDKEFSDLFSVEPFHKTKFSSSYLAQILPYYASSDYEMLQDCQTSKDELLEFLENNNFTSVYNTIVDGLSAVNFSCKYYNEDKFNSIIPKKID